MRPAVGIQAREIEIWCLVYIATVSQDCKPLRDENTRLRKRVADLSLDKEGLQSVIRKNGWSW